MKKEEWKQKKSFLKQKKFRKYKYLKEVEKIEIAEPPEQLKDIYQDMKEPEGRKGNNLPKPRRFKNEVIENMRKKKELEEAKRVKLEKEEEKKKNEKKKKKFARMLGKTNKRGQPNLKSKLVHLMDRLNSKGLGNRNL